MLSPKTPSLKLKHLEWEVSDRRSKYMGHSEVERRILRFLWWGSLIRSIIDLFRLDSRKVWYDQLYYIALHANMASWHLRLQQRHNEQGRDRTLYKCCCDHKLLEASTWIEANVYVSSTIQVRHIQMSVEGTLWLQNKLSNSYPIFPLRHAKLHPYHKFMDIW